MQRLSVMGSLQLSLYLKGAGREDIIEKNRHILRNKSKEELKNELKSIEHDRIFSPKKKKDARILSILSFCYNSPLSLCCIELCAFFYQFPEVGNIFTHIPGGRDTGVTLRMAASCLGYNVPYECYDIMKEAHHRLQFILSFPKKDTFSDTDFSLLPFYFDERLFGFCETGVKEPDHVFGRFASFFRSKDAKSLEIYGYKDISLELKNKISKNFMRANKDETFLENGFTVVISGENESGRGLVTKSVLGELGFGLFTVDYSFVKNYDNPKYLLNRILRECILEDACLMVRDVTAGNDMQTLTEEIAKAYSILGCRPLVFTVRSDVKMAFFLEGNVISLDIPTPGREEAMNIWRGYLEKEELLGKKNKLDLEELASKLTLTPGQIKRISSLLKAKSVVNKDSLTNYDVFSASYEVLDDGRYQNIKRVKTGYKLSDLKVPENITEMLYDICNQANHRKLVYDTWGMGEKFRYGRCISAIFAGPPGTGKTMAVHTLSSELGLELYKVDLSQVVDKYVGETQKRLEEIFTRAEKSNMILFFDEADAVMGKRSETTDAKDKYANTEVAYILQRIEEYDGIVILATNYLQNIDVAFMRRIRYVLFFPMPDEDTRKEIWKSSFSKKAPIDKDVDFDFLAKQFEISGGSIKNIVLNASFLAAADDEKIGMKHIIKATYRENNKDNRASFSTDYGGYQVYLPR